MKTVKLFMLFSIVFFVRSVLLLAEMQERKAWKEKNAQHFTVAPLENKIKIDGILNEEEWSGATVIPAPYEWTPGDNIPGPVQTECLVTFDRHNLYVAFRCRDPQPSKIRAHLMDRDDTDTLILDDHVSFMVDGFNDERRAFQFRVNPLGVQADAIFSEMEGYEDFSWDAIWASAGKITDWGYAIETAIPLSQLRFRESSDQQTWGFSAERSWPRETRHRICSHTRLRNIVCILCQFNKLTGFAGIKPSRNIELDPTLTAYRTDAMKSEQFPDGGLDRGKLKMDPGISAKWGLTPNLILNAAVNPDFSQVEADAAQLDINRRFALFYNEKRPFFLEGADFFLTPIQAVFTRTVADPLWGAKLTGKMGRTAIGFFSAQDQMNNLLFPANQESSQTSLDQNIWGNVLRLRQDVGKNSTLGFLYTGRLGEEYANHVAGVDGFLRLDQRTAVSFQFLHTETRYPDNASREFGQKEGTFGGNALNLNFQHSSRRWIINSAYSDYSPGFRADYGFVPQVDIRSFSTVVYHQIWGWTGGWFDLIRLGVLGTVNYDYENALTERGLILGLMYTGFWQSVANFHANFQRLLYNGRYFNNAAGDFTLVVRPFSGAQFGFSGVIGEQVDFANSRPANLISLSPSAALSLGRHLTLTVSNNHERLFLAAKTIYTANLAQAKIIYNFDVRFFIRAILQYRDLTRHLNMYLSPQLPKTQGLFTQLLISYKLNPRTVLFLGYSDNALGLEGVDITRTDRTFFLKIAYAWQI